MNGTILKSSFLGFMVRLKMKDGTEVLLRNVTEIHFNASMAKDLFHITAFESDIHGTGITPLTANIEEFETELENEIAPHF